MSKDAHKQKCFCCGKFHDFKTCPYVESVCYSCNKKGHLTNMCKSRDNRSRPKFKPHGRVNVCGSENSEDEVSSDQDRSNELYTIAYAGSNSKNNSFVIDVE